MPLLRSQWPRENVDSTCPPLKSSFLSWVIKLSLVLLFRWSNMIQCARDWSMPSYCPQVHELRRNRYTVNFSWPPTSTNQPSTLCAAHRWTRGGPPSSTKAAIHPPRLGEALFWHRQTPFLLCTYLGKLFIVTPCKIIMRWLDFCNIHHSENFCLQQEATFPNTEKGT